jgi:hypothetical protein
MDTLLALGEPTTLAGFAVDVLFGFALGLGFAVANAVISLIGGARTRWGSPGS